MMAPASDMKGTVKMEEVDSSQNVKWYEIEQTSAKLVALPHQSEQPGMKVDDLLSKSAVHSL